MILMQVCGCNFSNPPYLYFNQKRTFQNTCAFLGAEMGQITFESIYYLYFSICSLPFKLPLQFFWKYNHYHYHYLGSIIITITHYFWLVG